MNIYMAQKITSITPCKFTSLLSAEQHSIVIGHLLGDGYISKTNSLQIEQSLDKEAYVQWSYQRLGDLVGKPPKRVTRLDKRTLKNTYSLRFYTKCRLKEYRQLFYGLDGHKQIPYCINDLLDPFALAVWFMDDGGKAQCCAPSTVYWNVTGFSEESQLRLKHALEARFLLQTSLQKIRRKCTAYALSTYVELSIV